MTLPPSSTPRASRPAGWHSRAERERRRQVHAATGESRDRARSDAGVARAAALAAVDRRLQPVRDFARRRLAKIESEAVAPPELPTKKAGKFKRDPRTPVVRAMDDRRDQVRKDWGRRHPAAASAERTLRKDQADTIARWKHKNEGTPETHARASRTNQGPLAQLYERGVLDAEQLLSAVEIAAVAERIGAGVQVRTASLEARVDKSPGRDGAFHERLGQVRREQAYTRWREAIGTLRGPRSGRTSGAVLDMIVGGADGPIGFSVVAARYGMGHRRARALLIAALDLWPPILGAAIRDLDDATLAAAHAGLLS